MRGGPVEAFLGTLVGAVGGALFVLEGLIRWQSTGDGVWIRFPLVVLVLELVAVAGLIARFRPARLTAVLIYGLIGLVHLLAVLAEGPVWVRVLSAVLSALHVFGMVLLNMKPAREHFGGAR
ncbi:hypothetical protein [Saccharothrix variisporea]|uniref:DUF2127 domain-containing protein n=1 Tax=Saccharothrix variisporea TaxID=543527 RepID=A0A495XGW8_9PSEU|nr:hypothetical protein [Saccharothrix variisporea]RKT73272.1 hypothetical protein DFJ66_6601 [Saccharothrix variisporea]